MSALDEAHTIVAAAQAAAIADLPEQSLIVGHDLNLDGVPVHFDADRLLALGERVARAFILHR